jgi:hypothetical protein
MMEYFALDKLSPGPNRWRNCVLAIYLTQLMTAWAMQSFFPTMPFLITGERAGGGAPR